MKKKIIPKGVKIIAILFILFAFIGIISIIYSKLPDYNPFISLTLLAFTGGFFIYLSIITLFISSIYMLKGNNWARIVAIVLSSIIIFFDFIGLALAQFFRLNITSAVTNMAVILFYIVTIIYLGFNKQAKAFFSVQK